MKLKLYADAEAAAGILQRRKEDDAAIAESVRSILQDVREDGDRALFVYSERFDGSVLDHSSMFVSRDEIGAAYAALDPALLASIKKAAANVLAYHKRDPMKDVVCTEDGRTTGFVVRPVERAGIYVPGGTARFFQVLNQNTFLRKMSVIRYTREAVHADAADIIRLAEAEGLSAHANAVRLRAEEE